MTQSKTLIHMTARPESEYCEDMGPVTWWRFPVEEAAWIGCPTWDNWIEGYYTHFTPHPEVPQNPNEWNMT